MFCPKCGSLLKHRLSNSGEKEEYCSCGFTKKLIGENPLKEIVTHEDSKIVVHSGIDPLANLDHTCSKCGYTKAKMANPDVSQSEIWCHCNQKGIEFICGKCGFKESQN